MSDWKLDRKTSDISPDSDLLGKTGRGEPDRTCWMRSHTPIPNEESEFRASADSCAGMRWRVLELGTNLSQARSQLRLLT